MKQLKHSPNQLKKQPLVSIIIPCFNDPTNVHYAIQSCIEQTYTNIEVIIIDDGSVPKLNIDFQLYPPNVKLVHQKNQGVAKARNYGVKLCKGEYLKFLDSDDELLPTCVETQVKQLLNSSDTISFIGYRTVFGKKSIEGTPKFDNFLDAIFQGNIAPLHCGLYPKSAIENIGGFGHEGPIGESFEDYDFHVKLAFSNIHTIVSHDVGVIYKKRPQSRSSDQKKAFSANIFILKQAIAHIEKPNEELSNSIINGLCDLAIQSGQYSTLFTEFQLILKKLRFSDKSEKTFRYKIIASNRLKCGSESAKKWWRLIFDALPATTPPTSDLIPPTYSVRASSLELHTHKFDGPLLAEALMRCLKARDIYLWGVSPTSEQWIQMLHFFGKAPTALVDSNPQAASFNGHNCIKPESLTLGKEDVIIICSKSAYFAIYESCIGYGWEENIIHFV
ncbi:glycosyltransferase family 2 protein [Pseudoalteromonas sp. J010]|uniref:glycosyltransferase family 2 protein n=1 Tax=Pseudoalteromonas sp. J010 TaxID=998465 RepID=UPI000F647418|nr:glycosyltransferase family A protein [Pseudoalteromonas sp. J010]RRS09042.1 glycosyltransferase family 2 protein [Pseudoalteromonas sp. J010]